MLYIATISRLYSFHLLRMAFSSQDPRYEKAQKPADQRRGQREPMINHISMDTILFPESVMHFYSYVCHSPNVWKVRSFWGTSDVSPRVSTKQGYSLSPDPSEGDCLPNRSTQGVISTRDIYEDA